MTNVPISLLTICGIKELDAHSARGVTHVLSILDPGVPEPKSFWHYDRHHRTTLHFHDEIEPRPGLTLPTPDHVEQVLAFGINLANEADRRHDPHLLVHCHMGISRSTAAMAALLAQQHADEDADRILKRLLEVRPQAWPNSRMIQFADEQLGRGGQLIGALGRLYARQLAKRPEVGRFMNAHNRSREVDMAIQAKSTGQMALL